MTLFQQLTPVICMALLIVLIVVTKKVLESSIIALFLAYLLVSPKDVLVNFAGGITTTLSGGLYTYLLSMVCIMGIFISLLQDSGGAIGFGRILGKYANTRKKSLVATFILGLIIFIDEYLNALVVTSSMRSLTDKHKVPRVMLATTVNAAGVPACIFAPISAWAVYYMALMSENGILDGTGLSELQMYIKCMPFMVYPAVFMVVILLLILGLFPKLKLMKQAYDRADTLGDVFSEAGMVGNGGKVAEQEGNILFFAVPLIITIVLSFVTGDIFLGVLTGVLVISIMLLVSKKMTSKQVVESAINGIKDMVYILLILLLLFTFTGLCEDLGFVELVVNAAAKVMTTELLPVVVFVVISALTFLMGSYWATSALCLPIVVQLATQLNVSLPLVLGALISAAVFPATCAFNSAESIMLSSQSAQIQPAELGLTNMPYALISLGISAVIYLALGFVM